MPESLLSEDEMINILAETGFFANKDTSHVKEVTIEYSSNGKGKYTWPDNGEYEGDFFEGEFHGKGKRIFPNGDIYEGEHERNYLTGKGKMTYADGTIEEGEWKDGEFLGNEKGAMNSV